MDRNWDHDLAEGQSYLAHELRSSARHEYVGGVPYAMTGASTTHNQIAANTLLALEHRLHGKPCRPFPSDTRVRVRLPFQLRFYYPDVTVTCHPNPQTDSFQDAPALLVEVVSDATRRIDEGEKLLAYTMIPSLQVYLLIEPQTARVAVLRRTANGFVRTEHMGNATIPLPEIDCELPLREVYGSMDLANAPPMVAPDA